MRKVRIAQTDSITGSTTVFDAEVIGINSDEIIRVVKEEFAKAEGHPVEEDGSTYIMQALVDNGPDHGFILKAEDLVSCLIVGIVYEDFKA